LNAPTVRGKHQHASTFKRQDRAEQVWDLQAGSKRSAGAAREATSRLVS